MAFAEAPGNGDCSDWQFGARTPTVAIPLVQIVVEKDRSRGERDRERL